jgi:carbonic anhydrase
LLEKVKPAILNEKTETVNRTGENFSFVNKVAKENIQVTIQRIRTESEIVAQLEQDGKVKIVGGYHDLSTGIVSFF